MFTTHSPKHQRGATLIESLVAILIFSLGIIALMGFQAASVANSSQGKYRGDASYFADQIIGQMWANGGNATLATYACNPCNAGNGNAETQAWFTQMQASGATRSGLPNANASIVIGPVGGLGGAQRATITIFWRAPSDPPPPTLPLLGHSYTVVTDITKNF